MLLLFRENPFPLASAPPIVQYKPESTQPPWIQTQGTGVPNAHMSFTNTQSFTPSPKPQKTAPQKPSPSKPRMAPPVPPTAAKPLAPSSLVSNPVLPPVRPGNAPPPAPKPAKLPPMVPKKA